MTSVLLDRAAKLIRHSDMSQTDIAHSLGTSPQRINDLLVREPSIQLRRVEGILQLLDGNNLSSYVGTNVNTVNSDMLHRLSSNIKQLAYELEENAL